MKSQSFAGKTENFVGLRVSGFGKSARLLSRPPWTANCSWCGTSMVYVLPAYIPPEHLMFTYTTSLHAETDFVTLFLRHSKGIRGEVSPEEGETKQ